MTRVRNHVLAGRRILVTGGGGFIGGHLVRSLVDLGAWVRAVDIRAAQFGMAAAHEFVEADLRRPEAFTSLLDEIDVVFAMAADIGGMGHISKDEFSILHNNTLIDLNTFGAIAGTRVSRVVYASSACIYPQALQCDEKAIPLREDDAWPAGPEGAYGFEKLAAEVALHHLGQQHSVGTVAVRLHNIYGPMGTFRGGREKAPAAICRKVAEAVDGGTIDVWGDGRQVRSFCYISDAIHALTRLATSEYRGAINIGSEDSVTVAELVSIVSAHAGKRIGVRFVPGPQGVRSRNSDSTLARQVLEWSPRVGLSEGLDITYQWIRNELGALAR